MKLKILLFGLLALTLGMSNAQQTITFDITAGPIAAIAVGEDNLNALDFNIDHALAGFGSAFSRDLSNAGFPDAFRLRYAFNKTVVAGGSQFFALASIDGGMAFTNDSTGTALNASQALAGTVFTFTSAGPCTDAVPVLANNFVNPGVLPVPWYNEVATPEIGSRETAVFTVVAGTAAFDGDGTNQFIGPTNVAAGPFTDSALVEAVIAEPVPSAGVVNAIRGAVCGSAEGDGVTFNLAVTNVPALVPAGTYKAELTLTLREKTSWTLVGVIDGGPGDGTPAD